MSVVVAETARKAPAAGRRERKSRETRRRILLAALDLFTERDPNSVTVEEIAERADVARGTVFNYFSTKESLCRGMGELQLEMLEEAIAEGRVPGPRSSDRLEQALRLMAEFPWKNPDQCRVLLTRALATMTPGELPEHRRRVLALIEGWVREGQESGEFRRDHGSHELAGFIMGLQLQAVLQWAIGFARGPLGDHVAFVLRLGLEGLKAD